MASFYFAYKSNVGNRTKRWNVLRASIENKLTFPYLFFCEFTSTFGDIYICLFTDNITEAATHTLERNIDF